MANVIFAGYMMPVSNKMLVIADHQGPVSYTTGGETIRAADFGLGGFEFIEAGNLDTFTVNGQIVQLDGVDFSATNVVSLRYAATTAPGVPAASIVMKWYVITTGAEVANTTNLSSKSVRLRILGV